MLGALHASCKLEGRHPQSIAAAVTTHTAQAYAAFAALTGNASTEFAMSRSMLQKRVAEVAMISSKTLKENLEIVQVVAPKPQSDQFVCINPGATPSAEGVAAIRASARQWIPSSVSPPAKLVGDPAFAEAMLVDVSDHDLDDVSYTSPIQAMDGQNACA